MQKFLLFDDAIDVDGDEIPDAQALHDPLKRGHGDDALVLVDKTKYMGVEA